VWILGLVVVAVIVGCVLAIFLAPGRGPFAALSDLGRRGRIYTTRGATDFHDDLRKPRNENELL
jgi:hypothetical protein